jgi:NAD(P)-dependent dehydrogenase (short-subunit alcohol dehydrogenase family)
VSSVPDKVLVVTGGSRGIGAAVANLAGDRGYAVAVAYQSAERQAADIVQNIGQAGSKAAAFQVDVTSPDSVERMFVAVEQTLGRPAALVNSAGSTGGARPILELEPSMLQSIVATNLFGTIYCIRAAALRMARSLGGSGGAIVNLSSEAARFGGNRLAAYAAAKAGVSTFTIAAARELAAEGIRVNAVSPGVIATDQHAGNDAQRTASLLASIPLGRMGTAAEVAQSVLWLLSDEASYITGSVLSIHGGR